MKKILRIFGLLVCAGLLLLIRAYESVLFYDPLLEFFKMDYKTTPLPEMDEFSLALGVAFRYFLNAVVSLAILWLVFWDKGILKLSGIIYLVLFLVFLVIFMIVVNTSEGTGDQLVLFYVRRFLIQPLFLLILLPAFYFQKRKAR